jgi:3-oxoacyl-[acyl-carrier protein] reductase
MDNSLNQRIAVVTGASRGLGKAIARELARRGAFVVINYRRNEDEAKKTLQLIESEGGQGRLYGADVARPEQLQKMFQELYKDHKRIDILVNNAGINRDELFIMMRQQSWDELMNVHLNAAFHCCKAVVRQMCAARRGVIVNIGSGSAISPRPGQVNYSAAKSGLIGFSRSLAREVADKGVRVLHVAPGFTQTQMSDAVSAAVADESVRFIPLGRWGLPEELADVVGYLVSDDAAYVTGQTFVLDGGRGSVEVEYGFGF